jgi:hypothetical protein
MNEFIKLFHSYPCISLSFQSTEELAESNRIALGTQACNAAADIFLSLVMSILLLASRGPITR